MYDPQPVSDRPVGLGFPHRTGRFRPGGSAFSSSGFRSCKGIKVFFIRGWKPIFPGVPWLYVRSPANQQPASGAGVSTPCGAVSTRETTVFVPRLSELQMYGGSCDPGMGLCRPRVALILFSSPSQSAIGRRGWVSTPCGAVSTRGITLFVTGLSELCMYGGIFDTGMGTYPLRVRRDRGVPPRGNSRRARRAPSLAKGWRGGGPSANGIGARKTLG